MYTRPLLINHYVMCIRFFFIYYCYIQISFRSLYVGIINMQLPLSVDDLQVLSLDYIILPRSPAFLLRVQTTLMNLSLRCHIQGIYQCYSRKVCHGFGGNVDACAFDNDTIFRNITLMKYEALRISNNTPDMLLNISDIPLKILLFSYFACYIYFMLFHIK